VLDARPLLLLHWTLEELPERRAGAKHLRELLLLLLLILSVVAIALFGYLMLVHLRSDADVDDGWANARRECLHRLIERDEGADAVFVQWGSGRRWSCGSSSGTSELPASRNNEGSCDEARNDHPPCER
jgi:hypothetical protein